MQFDVELKSEVRWTQTASGLATEEKKVIFKPDIRKQIVS